MPQKKARPKLVLSGGTGKERPLKEGLPFRIGQAQGAEFRVPHPSLGQFHCALIWEGDRILLRDMGSELGTRVNDRIVTQDTLLSDGDKISAGNFMFELVWPHLDSDDEGAEEDGPDPNSGDFLASPNDQLIPSGSAFAGDDSLIRHLQFKGKSVEEARVFHGMRIGSEAPADLILPDPLIDPIHAVIESSGGGYRIIDSSSSGTHVNGRLFKEHELVIGDFLQFGDYCFLRYDGFALRRVRNTLGSGLVGAGIAVDGNTRKILDQASFLALPGQFVGILGPSGAGKTTLLRALSGMGQIDAGTVWLDGRPLDQIPDPSLFLGFVPQEEIVHRELTGREALLYAALLRLPARTPQGEIERLIGQLAERLGLLPHLDTRASSLSGGQLKRLSVCVELLARPSLLFLDEPTSGLDPESEGELMEQLQELTYTGCTVVATTHLMENVYLMNSIEVVMAGKDPQTGQATPGTSIFRGRARVAKEFFGVNSLTKLYRRLGERSPAEWISDFERSPHGSAAKVPPDGRVPGVSPPSAPPAKQRRRPALPILLRRQAAIFAADPKNLVLFVGQPLIIGLLVAIVAVGDEVVETKLFLAAIATLWLACSNAAQEIVRERPIFRREQFVGLKAPTYLLAKFLALGWLGTFQALLLYLVIRFVGTGLEGSFLWQLAGLAMAALAATGIGLAISAWAKTPLQAVLFVPLVIIPQILFAGYVFPLQDWTDHPAPRLISRAAPSFAAQRTMDTSLLWGRMIDGDLSYEYNSAYRNLETALYPWQALWRSSSPVTYHLDESKIYRINPDYPRDLEKIELMWTGDPLEIRPTFAAGDYYAFSAPALRSLGTLAFWTITTFVLALLPLRRKA